MIASVPVSAAPGPPETGASMKAAPALVSVSEIRIVAASSVVE
jgi:hypothetical protein